MFTVFTFGGQPITFCQQVQHTSPQFVGQGFAPIQPMDEPAPVEILTPAAAGPGQLVLNLIDLFGKGGSTGVSGVSKVWDRLGATVGGGLQAPFGALSQSGTGNVSTVLPNVTSGNGPFAGLVDIVDIAIAQAQLDPSQMQIVKYIRPLPVGGQAVQPYFESYVGCVITNVVDGEQVDITTLQIMKQITVAYRYLTRNGVPSRGFALRDAAL
jgi:hypothetical protein